MIHVTIRQGLKEEQYTMLQMCAKDKEDKEDNLFQNYEAPDIFYKQGKSN